MHDTRIGVIGNGFVGGAVIKAFTEYCDVKFYDKNDEKSQNTLEDVVSSSDIVFVCLPTPMENAEGGKADLSIIKDTFHKINQIDPLLHNEPTNTIYVIKSTVPVGTTQELSDLYQTNRIIHSPEFLTARCANIDFITATRHVIGLAKMMGCGKGAAPFVFGNHLTELFEERFPGCNVITTSSSESEFINYAANCFFASKVMIFNEMKLLSDKLDLNWDNIMSGVMTDGRIGVSHHQVPGHDGDRGFGGYCFPKDINSFINTMEENDVDPLIFKAVWDQNKNVRNNWDWVNSESSVVRETNEH